MMSYVMHVMFLMFVMCVIQVFVSTKYGKNTNMNKNPLLLRVSSNLIFSNEKKREKKRRNSLTSCLQIIIPTSEVFFSSFCGTAVFCTIRYYHD